MAKKSKKGKTSWKMRATMKVLPILVVVVFIYLQCSFALNDGEFVQVLLHVAT